MRLSSLHPEYLDAKTGNEQMNNRTKSVLGFVVALTACYGAGGVGGLLVGGAARDWYPALVKPSWTPPAWVFGPVWTALYGMMAVAVWLVWLRRHQQSIATPIVLFVVQLAFNMAWSPLFFGLHRPGIAFADIMLLWLALVLTVRAFLRIHSTAGVLLVPYLLWVSFAGVLNFAIWRMNT